MSTRRDAVVFMAAANRSEFEDPRFQALKQVSNKCIATSNKCLTSSNKKLVETISY